MRNCSHLGISIIIFGSFFAKHAIILTFSAQIIVFPNVIGEKEMTNVETRSRAKPLLTMIILYSGVYSFIGAAFIHYTIHRSCPNLVDILLGVAIFVYSAILSYFLFYQWYSCCAEQPSNNYNTGKTKHALFTELFALLLFFALFQVLTGFFSWASAILCI